MHLQSLGCGFGASVRTRLSAGEAGAAPALGRRPTDPGTVTGTPRRPWHLLPARRASPASPPGSGGPPSAGMAVPLLRARAAEPGSHGDPARAGSCDPHWQTAARSPPRPRDSGLASTEPGGAVWPTRQPPVVVLPSRGWLQMTHEHQMQNADAPTLPWPESASGRIGALGLLVTLRLKPCVGLRARAAGQRRRLRAEVANDCIVLAGARFVAEGPALRAQHRGRPKGGEARQRPARSLAELPALEAGVVHKVSELILCQVRSTSGA